ncbi:MAG: alpha/beta hydrolase, partial [Thermoleophilia bacterium]|nr:alpha/beta hydrolase [Thermoleophilia bacterium]
IAGHVLPFDLEKLGDRAALRARLGYGPEPLLVVAVGGTGAGSALLDLCLEAFPAARREMPGLQMLLVCGPRVAPPAGDLPPGVETRGYVPTLHEHFAVCDLAIVQGGSTATLELTALQRPFLFFPLQGHCEQMKHVAARQRRLGAGVQLDLGRTTAAALSRQIVSTIGGEVHYPPLKADGAREIARLVLEAAGERPAP